MGDVLRLTHSQQGNHLGGNQRRRHGQDQRLGVRVGFDPAAGGDQRVIAEGVVALIDDHTVDVRNVEAIVIHEMLADFGLHHPNFTF